MSRKSKLTREFENLFGNLNSRIELLVRTQSGTLDQYIDQLPGYMAPAFKKVIAASYLLCLTEEIFQVTFENFRVDMVAFASILGFDFRKSASMSSHEFVDKFLSKFIQILKLASDSLQEMTRALIVELAQGYPQELVQTIAILKFLRPLFLNALEIVQKSKVDLRFIGALLAMTIEDFIDRKTRLKKGEEIGDFSITSVYEQFKKEYPLSQGNDLVFDICNKLIIERTWTPLQNLVQKEIDDLAESIATQREDSIAQYHATKARLKQMYSDDYYIAIIAGRLFELFQLERPLTPNLRSGIVNATDTMIRRYLVDRHGYSSASGKETLDVGDRLLWGTVWETPQVLAAIMEPKEIMQIMRADNPRDWLKIHESEFKRRFTIMLGRYAGHEPLPATIGNAFIKILEDAQRMKVRITFD